MSTTIVTTDIVKSGSTVHSQKFRGYIEYDTEHITDPEFLVVEGDFGMCVTDTGTWSSNIGWNISVSDSVGSIIYSGSLPAATRSGTAPKYWRAESILYFFERKTYDYDVTLTLTATSATQSAYTATKEVKITVPKRASFDITYHANGGSGGPTKQTAYYNIPLQITSSKPSRLNYVLDYWEDFSYNQYVPGQSYTFESAKDLYAHWLFSARTITATYSNNGRGGDPPGNTYGSNSSGSPSTFSFTTAAAMENTDTHTFSGWGTSSSGPATYQASSPVYYTYTGSASSVILPLYAIWTEKPSYIVIFDVQGHGTAPTSQYVISGLHATEPDPPTAEGWVFKGWYTTSACETEFDFENTAITDNTYIYAKWNQSYTVTFNANGHGTSPESQTIESGGLVTRPTDPTVSSWQFNGWYKEQGCANVWNFETDTVSQNTTLWAKWLSLHTVMFNMQGHGEQISPQTVVYGGHVTEPTAPTASGYVFGGWYEDSACTDSWNFSTDTVTGTMTLWAKWTLPSYTVTFNMMGHGTQVSPQTVTQGSTATEPTDPTATGWIFGGWYEDESFLTQFDFSTPITANTTLYAMWTKELTKSYIGIGGEAKRISKIYIGIDGEAKQVTKAYIGVDGEAKPFM